MSYEYSGYLSTILYKPDPSELDSMDSITFGPEDIVKWSTKDLDNALYWQNVPVSKTTTDEGVHIEGPFQNVMSSDSLTPDDHRYCVPLPHTGLTHRSVRRDAHR